MITKDNFKVYQNLFAQINEKLNFTNGNEITDIDDYFMELEKIRDYVTGTGTPSNPQNDPIFLILPADEGLFEINANTRKIDIPADFNRNGVGVQGDELAEIVYFSIDRYFDIIDLYDKEIFVQWEASNGDKGLSVTINKTLSYAPGKVVFGWPITNEITKNAGNVKFAVRFYERGTDSAGKTILTYSFSTLTSTIKINQALDFVIDDENSITAAIIDKNNQIYNNLRDSEAEGVDYPAVIPTFDLTNLLPTPPSSADSHPKYDLPIVLKGHALFTNKDEENGFGVISYYWKKYNKEGEPSKLDDTPSYVQIEANEEKNDYDSYFFLDNNGNYQPYKGDFPPEEGITVYKLYATLTPESAGKYYLIAENYAGRGNTAETSEEKSPYWIISFPKAPNIIYPKENDIETKNIIMVDHSGEVYADLTVEIENLDSGELTYQWKKSTDNNNFQVIDGQTGLTLKVNTEGYYLLDITNNKNNDTLNVSSDVIRVTNAPKAIPEEKLSYTIDGMLVTMPDDGYEINSKNKTLGIQVNISNIPSDEIIYQWYRKAFGEGNTFEAIPDATSSSYTVTNLNGSYQVKIINKYNEHQSTVTESKIFKVFIS